MRVNDLMLREERTITADGPLDESIIVLMEPRTRGLPVADDKNQWIDFVKHLNIGARQSVPLNRRNIDRIPTPQGSMGTREGQ